MRYQSRVRSSQSVIDPPISDDSATHTYNSSPLVPLSSRRCTARDPRCVTITWPARARARARGSRRKSRARARHLPLLQGRLGVRRVRVRRGHHVHRRDAGLHQSRRRRRDHARVPSHVRVRRAQHHHPSRPAPGHLHLDPHAGPPGRSRAKSDAASGMSAPPPHPNEEKPNQQHANHAKPNRQKARTSAIGDRGPSLPPVMCGRPRLA